MYQALPLLITCLRALLSHPHPQSCTCIPLPHRLPYVPFPEPGDGTHFLLVIGTDVGHQGWKRGFWGLLDSGSSLFQRASRIDPLPPLPATVQRGADPEPPQGSHSLPREAASPQKRQSQHYRGQHVLNLPQSPCPRACRSVRPRAPHRLSLLVWGFSTLQLKASP